MADVTKLKGSHTLKFGADGRLFRTFANRLQTMIAPDFSFANTYTKGPLDNSTAAPLGQELAALLMGIPGGSMTRNPTASYATQNKYFGVYLQDDIKLTPRLTLNLGLRYEYEWPLTERFNRLVTAFDANATSPIAAQATANMRDLRQDSDSGTAALRLRGQGRADVRRARRQPQPVQREQRRVDAAHRPRVSGSTRRPCCAPATASTSARSAWTPSSRSRPASRSRRRSRRRSTTA